MGDPSGLTRNTQSRRDLTRRLAAATSAAHDAADRYLEVRRRCELTVEETVELLAASRELRERLRQVMCSYASILRRDGTSAERLIALVEEVVETSGVALEPSRRRALVDEVMGWALEAYTAA